MCLHVCLPVWKRIIVRFRLKGSSCLLCSVFSSCRLGDRDWEELCLGAVGGLTLPGLMHPFITIFLQRHRTRMTSFSTLQQQRWWKIPQIYSFIYNNMGEFLYERNPRFKVCVMCKDASKYDASNTRVKQSNFQFICPPCLFWFANIFL